ncbi:hypothetical protein Pelo_6026 [Pelomyxa schiedti]|nr:hypothetical protein Pelo_15293 [Pelomyxa schiedti]KAH3762137.1 hypothetical protein Pelo_6026 [Pelomyxa schiedti]
MSLWNFDEVESGKVEEIKLPFEVHSVAFRSDHSGVATQFGGGVITIDLEATFAQKRLVLECPPRHLTSLYPEESDSTLMCWKGITYALTGGRNPAVICLDNGQRTALAQGRGWPIGGPYFKVTNHNTLDREVFSVVEPTKLCCCHKCGRLTTLHFGHEMVVRETAHIIVTDAVSGFVVFKFQADFDVLGVAGGTQQRVEHLLDTDIHDLYKEQGTGVDVQSWCRALLSSREQFVALAAASVVPRCGARSPARVVPPSILAAHIGRPWVHSPPGGTSGLSGGAGGGHRRLGVSVKSVRGAHCVHVMMTVSPTMGVSGLACVPAYDAPSPGQVHYNKSLAQLPPQESLLSGPGSCDAQQAEIRGYIGRGRYVVMCSSRPAWECLWVMRGDGRLESYLYSGLGNSLVDHCNTRWIVVTQHSSGGVMVWKLSDGDCGGGTDVNRSSVQRRGAFQGGDGGSLWSLPAGVGVIVGADCKDAMSDPMALSIRESDDLLVVLCRKAFAVGFLLCVDLRASFDQKSLCVVKQVELPYPISVVAFVDDPIRVLSHADSRYVVFNTATRMTTEFSGAVSRVTPTHIAVSVEKSPITTQVYHIDNLQTPVMSIPCCDPARPVVTQQGVIITRISPNPNPDAGDDVAGIVDALTGLVLVSVSFPPSPVIEDEPFAPYIPPPPPPTPTPTPKSQCCIC